MAPLRLCERCGKKRPDAEFYRMPNGHARGVCKRCDNRSRTERRNARGSTDATRVTRADVLDALGGGRGDSPESLFDAAQADDPLLLLEAMRDRVARELDSPMCASRDVPPLMKQLRELVGQIKSMKAEIDAEEGGSDDVPDEPFDPATDL